MAVKKKKIVTKKAKVTKKKQSFALQVAIAFIIIDVVAFVAYIYSSLH